MYADYKLLTSFNNYYFKRETYENCFKEIGFQDFECKPLTYLGTDEERNLWNEEKALALMKAYKIKDKEFNDYKRRKESINGLLIKIIKKAI